MPKILSPRYLILWVLAPLLGGALSATAQDILKGTVTAADSGKPLAGASIFISNTSRGTVTDEKGNFTLGGIPSGRYVLVISSVGYETDLETIDSRNPKSRLEVVLRLKVAELGEVTVRAFDKDGYKKWGALFQEKFIGTSDFARDCKILNPEVLRIHYAPKSRVLSAYSDGPIMVENKALGYDVQVNLENFRCDLNSGGFQYSYFPLFKPMAGSASKEAHWAKNRAQAYFGSALHFFRSFYEGRLEEEGYSLRMSGVRDSLMVRRLKNHLRETLAAARDSAGPAGAGASPEALLGRTYLDQYDQQLDRLLDESPYDYPGEVSPAQLIVARDSNVLVLEWDQSLKVSYLKSRAPEKYFSEDIIDPNNPESGRKVTVNRKVIDGMTTRLELARGFPMEVYPNGSYLNSDLHFQGYWSWWQTIGDMLPYDYEPPKDAGPSTK